MKLSERDKMLLVLLAIVLLVAVAYLLPGVGMSAAMEKTDQYEEMKLDQEDDNNVLLYELRSMGISVALAERSVAARNDLNNKIDQYKVEASRLAGNIMEYMQTYGVDEAWIDGLEYRYGVTSDESELLVNYNKSNDVTGQINNDLTYEDNKTNRTYTIKSAERTIAFEVANTAETYYQADLMMEGYSIEEMGALLLFVQHMASKGSLLIDSVTYDVLKKSGTVSITVLMTETNSISIYQQEIEQKNAEEIQE